jgi:pheromone shutdown protein TraB
MPGETSQSPQFESTRSLRPDLQLERYLVTACSLILAVVLVVGAAGYAGIHQLLSTAAPAPKVAHLERVSREAEADSLVTPAAIVLALIAGFLLAPVPNRQA